jgi:hypothetical protein
MIQNFKKLSIDNLIRSNEIFNELKFKDKNKEKLSYKESKIKRKFNKSWKEKSNN